MTGPFIQLTEAGTSLPIFVNLAIVTSIAPHGRGGSLVIFTGGVSTIEVTETHSEIAAVLEAASVIETRETARP